MKYSILLFFILSTSFAFSQEVEKDIKVGLVLSGGGAKGFAHVSALKVIEDAGVRIDYIGGTSMGAIIGALYASGYRANELDSIVRNIDFDKVMQDNLPRKSKPFYEKENGEKYAITLPVKHRKIGLPTAISEGQNVLNILTELTQHVNHINDFSKLPIPFLCIATNLETGKQEVLKSGFLPKAVKASSAFPTLLGPVEIDGKLLSDGGIVNNFPVDEVLEMGADVIIAIDIQSGLEKKEDLDSAVKILNQIVGFQMYKSYESKLKNVAIYIKPDLTNYNVVSFDKLEEIFLEGEIKAKEKKTALKKLASLQKQSVLKRSPIKHAQKFLIERIEIEGNKYYTRDYLIGNLKLNIEDSLSYKKLISGINNLSATGNFKNIEYQIVEKNDKNILKFNIKEVEVSTFLQISAHYDHLYKTGILLNVTSKHLLTKNDVLSTDFIVGDNIRYNLNYFIDNGFNWSYGLKSRFNSFNTNINFDDLNVNKLNLNYEDLTNQIYLQTVFNRKFAIRIGAEHKILKIYTETISSENNSERLYFDKSNYTNAFANVRFDTYDKKYFQKEGAIIDINYKSYLHSTNYNNNFKSFSQLYGKLGYAHTIFNKLTFDITSEGGITFGNNENIALNYILGGYGANYINTFIPLYGYEIGDVAENTYLKSAITLRFEMLQKHYLSARYNIANIRNDLFDSGDLLKKTHSGFAVGYGLDTFLGPIEINHMWSPETDKGFWYFNVGFWF